MTALQHRSRNSAYFYSISPEQEEPPGTMMATVPAISHASSLATAFPSKDAAEIKVSTISTVWSLMQPGQMISVSIAVEY